MGFDKGTELDNTSNLTLGRFGHKILTSVNSITAAEDYFCCIQILEAANIDYVSSPETHTDIDDASQTGINLPSGFALFGRLEKIKVNSGRVIVYLG